MTGTWEVATTPRDAPVESDPGTRAGESCPVDAMAYAWSGKWPQNRASKQRSLKTPVAFQKVEPGSRCYAAADCVDREGDKISYAWDIRAESSDRKLDGDPEAAPPFFPDAIKAGHGSPRIEFRAPDLPGA